MTASGKKLLESKDFIEDVMPYENWRLMDFPFLKHSLFSGSTQALLKTLFSDQFDSKLDKSTYDKIRLCRKLM